MGPPADAEAAGESTPARGATEDAEDAEDAEDTEDGGAGDTGKPSPAPAGTGVPAKPVKALDHPTTALRMPSAPTAPQGGGAPGKAPDQPTTALRVPASSAETDLPAATAAAPPAPPRPRVPPPPADSERDPLELLAALTNRPPPPPTPVRTVVRRVKIWTPLVLLVLLVLVTVQALRPLPDPSLELTAADSFTFDGTAPSVPWPETGQAALEVTGAGSFGISGGDEPVPIASLAKVMTAYLILRDHPLEPDAPGPGIEIDQQAEDDAGLEDDGESTVDVQAGDTISQREALQAILIASANNVARLLARWSADSEEAFVAEMNEAAAELGMENTTYTDPSGLNEDTVSTAADQVLLAGAAMADPVFRQIVSVSSYTDSYGVEHQNWNYLVPVDGVIGIKTGTTSVAGGCLLFAAQQEVAGEQRQILGAVLSQPPDPEDDSILVGALNAGEALMDFAQDQLRAETVFEAGEVVGQVDDGLGGTTPVAVAEDVTAVGWPGLEVRLFTDETGTVPHSAGAGTEVGSIRAGASDGAGEGDGVPVPLELAEDLSEPGLPARLTRLG